jgi:hypothetical protein
MRQINIQHCKVFYLKFYKVASIGKSTPEDLAFIVNTFFLKRLIFFPNWHTLHYSIYPKHEVQGIDEDCLKSNLPD